MTMLVHVYNVMKQKYKLTLTIILLKLDRKTTTTTNKVAIKSFMRRRLVSNEKEATNIKSSLANK